MEINPKQKWYGKLSVLVVGAEMKNRGNHYGNSVEGCIPPMPRKNNCTWVTVQEMSTTQQIKI